jgi:hypothetical protein
LCIIHCSESSTVNRSQGDDLQLDIAAVRSSLHPFSKNDGRKFGNRTKIDYRRRRNSGDSSVERRTCANSVMKSVSMIQSIPFDTLKSTWIATSKSGDAQQQHDVSTVACEAAKISGFTSAVCEHIIREFRTLTAQYVKTRTLSSKKHNRAYLVMRQRSQSYTHQ